MFSSSSHRDTLSGTRPPKALSKAHSSLLSQVIVAQKPFHSEGVWSFPSDHLSLFYQAKNNVIKRLPFSDNPSEIDLQALSAACQPATFGVNKQDVLDESYRKAGKIDGDKFAINLGVESSGLLDFVNRTLLGWEGEERPIRAELYKLNVYGPGSFFKAHKDTPRGQEMFGSLVIVLPTSHVGGALHLRHGPTEVVHDCSGKPTPSDSVSWIAFYSDVDHEVSEVKSGYRVTLTYNLYFADKKHPVLVGGPISSTPLYEVFSKLLADPEFLPDGGTLGFGLKHQYPITQGNKEALTQLTSHLKGGDASLFAVAQDLKLDAKLKVVYEDEYNGSLFMSDFPIENIIMEVEDMHDWFRSFGGAKIGIGEDEEDNEEGEDDTVDLKVDWTTERSETSFTTYFIAYGNESTLGEFYTSLNLLVTVGDKASRSIQ